MKSLCSKILLYILWTVKLIWVKLTPILVKNVPLKSGFLSLLLIVVPPENSSQAPLENLQHQNTLALQHTGVHTQHFTPEIHLKYSCFNVM